MFKFDIVHVYTNATVYDCDICIRCAHESQKADTSDEMKLRVFMSRAMLSYGSVRYFTTNIVASRDAFFFSCREKLGCKTRS